MCTSQIIPILENFSAYQACYQGNNIFIFEIIIQCFTITNTWVWVQSMKFSHLLSILFYILKSSKATAGMLWHPNLSCLIRFSYFKSIKVKSSNIYHYKTASLLIKWVLSYILEQRCKILVFVILSLMNHCLFLPTNLCLNSNCQP